MDELMGVLATALADRGENSAQAFTYRTDPAGERMMRVQWIGGVRNGVAVPSGDVTIDLATDAATMGRLKDALRSGGFSYWS